MKFGLIIIGDEIMSGRREDKHFAKVRDIFAVRGLMLSWVEYLGDERARIEQTIARALASGDVVFSCGGIGATPDDHTRQSAALALGEPLALHPEANVLITDRARALGMEDMTSQRGQNMLKMGEFPASACIIPNPYNGIPGFNCGQGYFVPGFPVMAWPMIEWVLDTHYTQYFQSMVQHLRNFYVFGLPESTITPLMEHIEAQYAGVSAFSLPSVGAEGRGRHIDLGVKGLVAQTANIEAAFTYMRAEVLRLGGLIEEE